MNYLALFIGALIAAFYRRDSVSLDEFKAVASEALEKFAAPTMPQVTAAAVKAWGTKFDSQIYAAAVFYNLDPNLLYRLLYQESRFRDDVITGKVRSPRGALGIAQFMPATAIEQLGSEAAALNPSLAIPGAAKYLRSLINQLGGDVEKAVAAYNYGIGNVKRKGTAKLPAETVAYVQSVYYGG